MEDINSYYNREDGPSRYDMWLFWSAYRGWLAARGVHLQAQRKHTSLWSPPAYTSPASLPYAERCSDDATAFEPPIPYVGGATSVAYRACSDHDKLKCAPAQDNHGRDLIIKLVNTYTHEYRILQDLLRCEALFGQDFQGVLPPVAILDTPYKFSFVVMPT